jgi:hypothetical protein
MYHDEVKVKKTRHLDLLERRAERRDEPRRELLDEADRVRQQRRAAARQCDLA